MMKLSEKVQRYLLNNEGTVQAKKAVALELAALAPAEYTEAVLLKEKGITIGSELLSVSDLLTAFVKEFQLVRSVQINLEQKECFKKLVAQEYLQEQLAILSECISKLQEIKQQEGPKWRKLSDVDFTVYAVDQRREANFAFNAFIQKFIIQIPTNKVPPTEERLREVEQVTEDFYSHFGQNMHSSNLYFLANYCMLDFIKMPKKNKTMNDEHGFLTPRQLVERQRRELSALPAELNYNRTKRLFPELLPQQRCTVNVDIDLEKA